MRQKEPTQEEVNRYYRRYRERLAKVEEEAKETKAKLIKKLAIYQALTVILAVALIVVLGV